MLRCAIALTAVALLAACSSSSDSSEQRKPTGTPTDPVLVCERVADVCRLDGSRLGVCVEPAAGTTPEECAGRSPCFTCMSQH